MPQDEAIYDLGEVDLDDRRPAAFPAVFAGSGSDTVRRDRPQRGARVAGRVGPQLAGSLSLFVPGLGHLVLGETSWGLFYAAGLGFCASALWAAFATRDLVLSTLRVLEIPIEAAMLAGAALAITAMLLHLSAISHAQECAGGADDAYGSHPIVAGLASFLVPGWGQILAGHPRRATFFIGSLWVLAGAWLAATPWGLRAAAILGLQVLQALREEWGTAALIAAPVILWVISVYDASRR